jgi:murein L,D-transpeptidase YcbB/YkuD
MSRHAAVVPSFIVLAAFLAAQSAHAEPRLPAAAPAQRASTAPAAGDTFQPTQLETADPIYGPETLDRTLGALRFYEEIVARGGWGTLGPGVRGLKQGQSGPEVLALKQRLAVSGDLDSGNAATDLFDAATTEALKGFQSRHGLSQTGSVGRLTFAALNVPADVRLNQLRASTERLRQNTFKFGPRYVVVNIPGAVVEAVANGQVERRHVAVVGRKDRQSPVIAARITSVNLNPNWTVPNSIIKADKFAAVRKDPHYLYKHSMRVLNWKGEEIDPNTVDWTGKKPINFMLRQDPGPLNPLGQVKIDMPNTEAVYMHDTPSKELFNRDVRFHSSGCARVSDVRELAAWLLNDTEIDRATIDREIAAGSRLEIKLPRAVPVAWVYITAWGDGRGLVQFREDIYGLDTPDGIALTTLNGKPRPKPPAPAPGPMVARPRAPASDPVQTGSITGQTRGKATRAAQDPAKRDAVRREAGRPKTPATMQAREPKPAPIPAPASQAATAPTRTAQR